MKPTAFLLEKLVGWWQSCPGLTVLHRVCLRKELGFSPYMCPSASPWLGEDKAPTRKGPEASWFEGRAGEGSFHERPTNRRVSTATCPGESWGHCGDLCDTDTGGAVLRFYLCCWDLLMAGRLNRPLGTAQAQGCVLGCGDGDSPSGHQGTASPVLSAPTPFPSG